MKYILCSATSENYASRRILVRSATAYVNQFLEQPKAMYCQSA